MLTYSEAYVLYGSPTLARGDNSSDELNCSFLIKEIQALEIDDIISFGNVYAKA